MEKMKFLNITAAILCCMFAFAVVSCDDDDEPQSAFKFSPGKVEVEAGSSVNVTVTGGTEPYAAVSSDEKITTVTINKNTIAVTGVKEGNAVIRVTDKEKKVGMLTVTVKSKAAALEFDKKDVNVAVGKDETITVKGGTAPYTVAVRDKAVATATVKDDKVTIKAVKAGKTTVTVTDKDKKTGTITVTVK